MRIGVPAEIKDNENRVAMTPDGVNTLVNDGHNVVIETGAGKGAGISDEKYVEAGAEMVDASTAWDADLVVKIKEPLASEYDYLDEETVLFTYFHLAAEEDLTHQVLDSGMTAIAYETVEKADGTLPLLRPMSQVAGRMAPLMGAYYLTRHNKGKGVLPPGIPGVAPAEVLVIGGGTVGTHAAKVAAGMGADVTVLEIDQGRMEELDNTLPANVTTRISNQHTLEAELPATDIVIGAVLVPGAEAPKVMKKDHLELLDDGSVIVDVAVDQGGCVETTRPTSHSDPIYQVDGVTHYAVTNMPGAYARTATFAITNATLPYVQAIANNGWEDALRNDDALLQGLNADSGVLTNAAVADAFDMDHTAPEDIL